MSVGYFCSQHEATFVASCTTTIDILELHVTWKQFDPFGRLLRFIVRARAMFSLGLIITSVEARLV